jgi:AcrR family transcriptional regulator
MENVTTTARERNPRGAGTRLRDEIVDAGIALIDATDDSNALTLRGIARQAGISAPSIYPHFADVTAVTDAVLERSFQQLEQAVTNAIEAHPVPSDALMAGCSAYVRFGWEHRARYRLMFAAKGFAPNAGETFDQVERAIIRCVQAGASVSTDPHADAFLLWVAMHGIATLEKPDRADYLRLGPLDRPALVHTLVMRLARLAAGA